MAMDPPPAPHLNTLTVWFLGGLGAEVQHSAYWMYLELFYFYGYWFIGTDWIGLDGGMVR